MMGLLFLLSGIWFQDGKAPEFTKFDFIRERIGHKVLVEGVLANTAGAELADVKLTSIYYDGNRELRRSKTARIAKVASGAKADFTLEADQVPNFTRYELYVEVGGSTRLYGGDEKAPMPTLRKAAGPNLSLVSSKDALPKTFPGDVVLTVVVKNDGGSAADEPTAILGFKVRGQEQLVRIVLDRAIAAGNEDSFEITIPGLEAYSSYESRVTFVFAEGPRPADPPGNVKELVVKSLRMVRMADGSGRVTGSFKNGLAVPVGEVSATFQVGKTDVPFTLPGSMAPGEQRPFELFVPSCPAFDGGGGYDLGFKEVAKAEPTTSKPPSVKKIGTRTVETRLIKLPPPPAKDKNNDPELNAKTRIKDYAVGVRGLMYVQGSYLNNGKYTGDVYLMRMIFLDDDGKPMKPTPTINMTVYNKHQPWGKVQRIVGKEMWNIDATKITSGNVADNTVACDKKTGELWVAFVRTDGPTFEPRADMTVVLTDLGT